jgi:hypothetical protein
MLCDATDEKVRSETLQRRYRRSALKPSQMTTAPLLEGEPKQAELAYPSRLSRCGRRPDRNLAAQRAPDLIRANRLCCRPGQGAVDAVRSIEAARVYHTARHGVGSSALYRWLSLGQYPQVATILHFWSGCYPKLCVRWMVRARCSAGFRFGLCRLGV